MKNLWTVLCHRGIVEQGSNQISLIGVIEKLTLRRAEGLPEGIATESLEETVKKADIVLLPIKMQLISYWTRSKRDEPEIAQTRSRFIGPRGKVLGNLEMDVDLTGHINRRTILKFDLLPFAGDGIYRATAHMRAVGAKRWKLCAENFVEIVTAKEERGRGVHEEG